MGRRRVHASRLCLAAYLGMGLLLLSSCTFGVSSERGPLPSSRQILHLGLDGYYVNLDPARGNYQQEVFPTILIFPPLLTVNNQLNVEPWAAESLPTFDPSANTYTFTIRPGLHWSDGTPIDANTYAYSLNRSLSPCTGSPMSYFLYPIKDAQTFSSESCSQDDRTIEGKLQTLIGDSIQVPSSQTLVIQLTSPAPYLLEALTTSVAFAQPEQLIERYGSQNWTQHLPDNGGFGGNLYQVKSMTMRKDGVQVLDLTACLSRCGSPSGWGTHRAAPPLRELEIYAGYHTTGDEQVEYQQGTLDVEVILSPTYRDPGKSSTLLRISTLDVDSLQLNWTKPPFTDQRARQAFALALDKDTLAKMLGDTPTNHIVPEGNPGYDPNLLGPDETTSTTGNVTLARQLLQSYADDACHGQFSRCTPVYVFYGPDTCDEGAVPTVLNFESTAIEMWRQAFPGYPVEGPSTGADCFPGILPTIADVPQAYTSGWVADYADAQDWLSLQFGPGAVDNPASVNLPAANALMAQADQTLDPAERTALYNQAEQLLVFNVAWIPIGQNLAYFNVRSTVSGFALTELGYPSLDQWYGIQMLDK